MQQALLATKLIIPESPLGAVNRPDLIAKLDAGVTRHRLTLVSAQAGYGKTTLLAEWSRQADWPVAWLTLESDDDDPERFFRYLLAAWRQINPQLDESPLDLLLGAQQPDLQATRQAFVNQASSLTDHQALVLDDYHQIMEPSIHQALTYIIDHLPPKLHIVLSTRIEPPLPLASYRAHGQLLELATDDLRFDNDAAAAFLHDRFGLTLTQDGLHQLQSRVEGWAAGLQLAAVGLQQRGDGDRPAEQLSGEQRYLADFLESDVLALVPAQTQAFLIQTCLLDQLCASLCQAVSGRADAQALLEGLERQNLFLQPVDSQRQWFRYHPLFADFLRAELRRRRPDELPGLHGRAARWYLENDYPDQAFQHAVAAEDQDLVIDVGLRYFSVKITMGELNTVRRWLDSVPPDWLTDHPLLALLHAAYLATSGDFEGAFGKLQTAEQLIAGLETEEANRARAMLTAFRCASACMQNDVEAAEKYGNLASSQLPEDDIYFREMINLAMGDTYRQIGRWQDARQHYLRALDLALDTPIRFHGVHAYGALADLSSGRGRLHQAAGYWEQAIAISQEPSSWGTLPLPILGWAWIRHGEILYEWNDLAAASAYLERGMQRAELGGDVRSLIAGHLLSARLALAGQDSLAAASHLEQAQPMIERADFPEWRSKYEKLLLDSWLADGRTGHAIQRAQAALESGELETRPDHEPALLGIARTLLTVSDRSNLIRALAMLERLEGSAQQEGRMGVCWPALALLAQTHWALGDESAALACLERALRGAQPEGYTRSFVDLGMPFAWLLQQARKRQVMPQEVERLLAAFDDRALIPTGGSKPIPEPLTKRELEVLQLMAAGLTNREIGERLVISVGTVKKHSANIYGKLGVTNRTEAAARARQLALLE